jgi:hypothetical protein
MHIITAYERRETLSSDDLIRLKSALADEVDRYRVAMRGYSPEKMREHGAPFLANLEGRLEQVSRILAARDADRV